MLDHIRNTPEATKLLTDIFDFDITRTDPVEPVHLANGGKLTPIAGDASGGTFFLCGNENNPVLYASSEGTAGILAKNLTEAIKLIIGIPTWHDTTSHSPNLEAMHQAFEASFKELKEDLEPTIEQHQTRTATLLNLPQTPTKELLEQLKESLTTLSPNYKLLNQSNNEYDPL